MVFTHNMVSVVTVYPAVVYTSFIYPMVCIKTLLIARFFILHQSTLRYKYFG